MKDRQIAGSGAEDLYGDIIHLPHYEPKNHKRMELYKRAAQFAPFAALTGYGEAIEEASRYTEKELDLSEDRIDQNNERMAYLQAHIEQMPEVAITYFEPDEKKDGGSFREAVGKLRKIDGTRGMLVMHDGQRIPVKNIIDLDLGKVVNEDGSPGGPSGFKTEDLKGNPGMVC